MGDEKKIVAYRAGSFSPRIMPWFAAGSIAGVIALLEALSRLGIVGDLFFPAPSAIGRALYELHASGLLWRHLGASLSRLVVGWSLGVAAGVVAGLAIGTATLARSFGAPWVAAVSAIPKIALLPLFIIWFGIGEGSKYATIAFGAFFPTVINTYGGVDNIPENLIRMAQGFNLKKSTIILNIILPGALPSILSAFRISASIGIILLVAAEMVSAEFGVGAYIMEQQNLFQLDRLMAGVVILMLLGLTVHGLIGLLERRLLHWR
ncbi:MAG: ABC transporter permease [Desulfobacterales bacterium]|nr:ABC transporter permease [Desulfobacterales bacterium]